ncbi:hypothetical protein [Rugamonas aquatica]|uniref:Uncharacterized protein n=1 Tax=Rugamonas aquatica TaxID=2743357 RepID=A0A6A7N6W6_9BURK|nr:hypothetical protein [Rugamonas aquatica]MQA40547.1 hypothetical protein [Rugamonas aquatica]
MQHMIQFVKPICRAAAYWPAFLTLCWVGVCGAADWQSIPAAHSDIRIDAESVVWADGRVQAWVWYAPVRRPLLLRILMPGELQSAADSKEQVFVNCHARSYRIGDFEGLPRGARYLGRAAQVLPDSDEAAVLAWLCDA